MNELTFDGSAGEPTAGAESPVDDLADEAPWWRARIRPIVGSAALLVVGLAYAFFFYPVTRNIPVWTTTADLWATFRDAHYIIWDGEGQVYNASTSFVTFPGIAVFLAPFAWLQEVFRLSDSWPVYLLKPTAWFVLGPVDMICGGVLLFPLDAIARRFSMSSLRRWLATALELVVIFPAVAFWGHPEDTLALAFGLYGLLAAHDRHWLRSACLFAIAVVLQPLTLLIVPFALAYVATRKWIAFGAVMSVPTVLLLIPPLIQEWGPTTYAIFKQPNFPTVDHPTPWLALAPVLTHSRWIPVEKIHYIASKHRYVYGPVRAFVGETVTAGPGRVIALVLACVAGLFLCRRRPSLKELVWWAAVALSLRCIFESVIDPYYLVPPLILAVLLAFLLPWKRCLLVLVAAAICTKTSYWHTGDWRYYLFVMVPLIASVALARPTRASGELGATVDDEYAKQSL